MTSLTRFPDWRLRFDSLIFNRLAKPFAWGLNDCALFAADHVLTITGVDLAGGLRGHRTARQAARTLRRHGGLDNLATSRLGAPIDPSEAAEGDLVLVPGIGRGNAMAVVCAGSRFILPGPAGLQYGSLDVAMKAWRVG